MFVILVEPCSSTSGDIFSVLVISHNNVIECYRMLYTTYEIWIWHDMA